MQVSILTGWRLHLHSQDNLFAPKSHLYSVTSKGG
jgi:hypothetical protein